MKEKVLHVLLNNDLTKTDSEYKEIGKVRITLDLNNDFDIDSCHPTVRESIKFITGLVASRSESPGGYPMSIIMVRPENMVMHKKAK